ncbi:MAG: hypothetical protein J0M26_04745 [Planctomycetes bacterium]|nr:hypothetical protein [Planctomycetota bacterium]
MSKLFKVFSLCMVALVLSSVGCSETKESEAKVSSQTTPTEAPTGAPTTPPLPKL